MSHRSRLKLLPLVLVAMLSFFAGASLFSRGPGVIQGGEVTAPLPGTNPYVFADVAEQASPAVVFISATVSQPQRQANPFEDPFFDFFFGDRFRSPRQPEARPQYGSGFLISSDGYILTNEHVVQGAEKIEVTVTGYEEPFLAQLVGSDWTLDLAVLKIEAQGLPILALGDSDASRVGEWVLAIGNPYGAQLDHTVTIGVVSAKGRQIEIPDFEKNLSRTYEDLMQTDAAINPGNSGGPLINIRGEVIGINTAVSTQGQGIGFAIPINTAKAVVEQLIEHGKIVRPWMGITYGEINEELAKLFDLPDRNGIAIGEVIKGSPADEAGLRRDDVIRRIDDHQITDGASLKKVMESLNVGTRVRIGVIRRGEYHNIFLTLAERPANM